MARPRKDATYPSLPSSENGRGVLYTASSGQQYYISHNLEKHKHTLWKMVADGYQRMATGDNPYVLYPEIDKLENVKERT